MYCNKQQEAASPLSAAEVTYCYKRDDFSTGEGTLTLAICLSATWIKWTVFSVCYDGLGLLNLFL